MVFMVGMAMANVKTVRFVLQDSFSFKFPHKAKRSNIYLNGNGNKK